MGDPPISPVADTLPNLAGEGAPNDTGAELSRGTSIGRYIVLERVGAGGMGVVHAAYDTKLDRRVALKALHAQGSADRDSAGRGRLVREAKAMARVSHPNVVTVYDVFVDGERAFVAMELVEGQSLREWLAGAARSWRAVVDTFIQAGRGLLAAHDAGMIHRDFKLDNVLIGDDGRARVSDFGLARSFSGAESAPRASDDLGPLVSQEGSLAGTPVYMAPAQLRGAPADARSDQFSFCAALYEALYGVQPFDGTSLRLLLDSMDSGRLCAPLPSRSVPGWLRAIVARGLSAKADDRYESMRGLLAALEKDPAVTRRRSAIGLLVLAAVGTAAGVAVHARRAEALGCRAVVHRLDGVWGDGEQRAVHDAFVATGRPYAEDTFVRTSRVLGGYASEWARQATAGCSDRSPSARGPLASQRAACLDDRLADLRTFAAVLSHADGEAVDRAVKAARALPGLDVCAGSDPTRDDVMPADPALRDDAIAVEEQMKVADALRATARYYDAKALAVKNVAKAEQIGFGPLTAKALLSLAHAQAEGRDPEAASSFRRASIAGAAAGATRVEAGAWLGLAHDAAERGEYERADERFDMTEALVRRTGDDWLRGKLLLARGAELNDEGKYVDARTLHLEALAIFERIGADDASSALNELGIDADMVGHYDEARGYYERSIALHEKELGPDHPLIADALNNLGLMASDQGKHDEAIAALERSLHIQQRAFGAERGTVAVTEYNLAMAYDYAHRYADALKLADHALAICEKEFGPESPDVGYALDARVVALIGLDRAAEGIAPAERQLAIRMKGGSAPITLFTAQATLGSALLVSGKDRERGRALVSQARDGFSSIGRTASVEEQERLLRDFPAAGGRR